MLHFKVKRDLKELTENGNFNDFLILENYLDQCVKLRLNGGEGDERNLKEAHDISTIITSKTQKFVTFFTLLEIFGILNLKFGGKIPVFELIEARKVVAKFIGLTFFKLGRECSIKFGPNCAIKGPCCPFHRLEGLKEAHDLFPKIFEPFGINLNKIDATCDTFFTTLLAVLIDFKTQIVVSDLALKSKSSNDCRDLSIHLENLLGEYYADSMEIPYLKGKLQQRAFQLRGLLEQQQQVEGEVNLSEILREKYPIDLFETNLKNILRNVYSALPETFLSELVKKETMKGAGAAVDARPMETMPVVVTAVKPEHPVTNNTTSATTNNITSATTNNSTSANNKNITSATNNTNTANVIANPFKNVLISGKFFRGILEPVDERFAAIIEARDVNVKQYLNQRAKKSSNGEKITIDQAKKENSMSTSNNNLNVTNKSLMERHDSAERISWETQQTGEESKIKEKKKEPVYRVVSLDNQRKQRGRRMFSDQEVLNLIEGIRRFGKDWRRILETYDFNDRTNVDLKDKARNLVKLGLL